MSDVDAIYYQNPFDLFDSYSTYFFHDYVWGQSFSHFTDKKGNKSCGNERIAVFSVNPVGTFLKGKSAKNDDFKDYFGNDKGFLKKDHLFSWFSAHESGGNGF